WAELSPLRPQVLTFSRDGTPVRCAKGLRVFPDTSADEVDPLHVLLYPGGAGTRALAVDREHLAWVRAMRARTPLVASVCTGALVLAAAGLLGGRPATTHAAAFDELAALDPSILADTSARFVDDGDVITSAGVSAGIDMALHLVARLENPSTALAVRKHIQYDPAPAG
ncbi:MAG: DJ-1/PfpI family protein, partial [Actinobacteria bacterium]|nr:DJ-1/PfpI family protein [Actinomycetota bacterium]